MNSMEKLSCWSCSWGQAHRLKGTVLRVILWLELSERCGSQLLFCDRRIWILVYLRYDRWARSTEFIAFSVVSHSKMQPVLIRMQPRTGRTILLTRNVGKSGLKVTDLARRRQRVLTPVGLGSVKERECGKFLSDTSNEILSSRNK